MENEFLTFKDKNVAVTLADNFIVRGVLRQPNQFGFLLESKTETSYVGYINVKMIKLDTKRYD